MHSERLHCCLWVDLSLIEAEGCTYRSQIVARDCGFLPLVARLEVGEVPPWKTTFVGFNTSGQTTRMSEKVKRFYDEFADLQAQRGTNQRHLRIMEWLQLYGLAEDSQVLEIGCGIGTQTELIANTVGSGRILANDISPRSVEMARKRLVGHPQVDFLVGDIVQLDVPGIFDFVVLPDVLEHIPIEGHFELFRKIAGLLSKSGIVVVHIPAPQYLEWIRLNHPEQLQVIDQPLHMAPFMGKVAGAGLYPHEIRHYSLWTDGPDAVVLALKHYRNDLPFNLSDRKVGWLGTVKRQLARVKWGFTGG